MDKKPIIVIAGGSGFFGSYLANFFKEKYSVVVLTRKDAYAFTGVKYVKWDGETTGDWINSLENSEALINLSGKSINCRFSDKNKKLLLKSRIDSTKTLLAGIQELKNPPKVFLNASAGAMYVPKDVPNVETDTIFKTDFLSKMALEWEETFFKEELPHTRRAALRISLILGDDGGVYQVLQKLAKLYLGGHVGSGKQKMSWIYIEDAARAVEYIIKNNIKGAVNLSTENVETNKSFMQKMRNSLGIPFGATAPALGVKMMSRFIDIEPSLVLNSVNFIPKKLIDSGFEFKFNQLDKALENLK
ncbi:MAG: TIGR01777 family oxidoreductase [Vicingaceae bacterium]|mgnify:CR=1 FL=1